MQERRVIQVVVSAPAPFAVSSSTSRLWSSAYLLHAISMITIASRTPCHLILHHQAELMLLLVLLLHLHGQEQVSLITR
jgi:hypothetical protein